MSSPCNGNHFSSIVAENCRKYRVNQPSIGLFMTRMQNNSISKDQSCSPYLFSTLLDSILVLLIRGQYDSYLTSKHTFQVIFLGKYDSNNPLPYWGESTRQEIATTIIIIFITHTIRKIEEVSTLAKRSKVHETNSAKFWPTKN